MEVHFSEAERVFYNALKAKSQSIFEGFIRAGTASKSWFAIFSLLHRLRQACDHVALTVKAHMDDADWNQGTSSTADTKPTAAVTPKESEGVNDEVRTNRTIDASSKVCLIEIVWVDVVHGEPLGKVSPTAE